MNPKEAQEQTEKRWLAIIASPADAPLACGWCMFALAMTTEEVSKCHKCPVVRVFGESCLNTLEYVAWEATPGTNSARKIYELLIAHRDHLIAAAKEIENERSGRVE